MRNRISDWWPLHLTSRKRFSEPGAVLFQGLRMNLTLWYCAVLCAALVLFGVVLYFVMQVVLLRPIKMDTAGHAHAHVGQWISRSSDFACSEFDSHNQSDSPPIAGFTRQE